MAAFDKKQRESIADVVRRAFPYATEAENAPFVDELCAAAGMPARPPAAVKPIDMVLYCPNCGMQHVDAQEEEPTWTNPPHRSHLCHGCACIWRPADVATNGVPALKTSGKGDTWPAAHNEEVTAMPARCVTPTDRALQK